jgi:hypothetical protein
MELLWRQRSICSGDKPRSCSWRPSLGADNTTGMIRIFVKPLWIPMYVCLSVCLSVCLCACVSANACVYIYRKEAWGFPERNWSGAGEKFGHVIFTAFYNVLWSSWYMKTHWTTSTRGQHTPGMLSVVETSFVFFKFFILCCFVETSRTACW